MSEVHPYSQTIRQCAHDAVRAVLAAPVDSPEGSVMLREVMQWLAQAHGSVALRDVAEELAVDLAEALRVLASVERRDPLVVADGWFHDEPAPGPDVGGGPVR